MSTGEGTKDLGWRSGTVSSIPETRQDRPPKSVVWLVNKGGHDYSSLESYGRVMPITVGSTNPFNPDRLMVNIAHYVSVAGADDYVAISGVPMVNALVLIMWLRKFPEVKVLQWSVREDKYVFAVVKNAAIDRNLQDAKGA